MDRIDFGAVVGRIEQLETARDIDRAEVGDIRRQARDQQTVTAQVATDTVNAVATVNQLKTALETALSGLEALVEDYGKFKTETARRIEQLEAAKSKPTPKHGWN